MSTIITRLLKKIVGKDLILKIDKSPSVKPGDFLYDLISKNYYIVTEDLKLKLLEEGEDEKHKYCVTWYNEFAKGWQTVYTLAKDKEEAARIALLEIKFIYGDQYTINSINSIYEIEDRFFIDITEAQKQYGTTKFLFNIRELVCYKENGMIYSIIDRKRKDTKKIYTLQRSEINPDDWRKYDNIDIEEDYLTFYDPHFKNKEN